MKEEDLKHLPPSFNVYSTSYIFTRAMQRGSGEMGGRNERVKKFDLLMIAER